MSNYSNSLKKNNPTFQVTLTDEMEEHLMQCTTISDQIRFLHSLSFTTGQIAKVLDIKYQHANNVINRPLKRG
jgi:hypothetical protein